MVTDNNVFPIQQVSAPVKGVLWLCNTDPARPFKCKLHANGIAVFLFTPFCLNWWNNVTGFHLYMHTSCYCAGMTE